MTDSVRPGTPPASGRGVQVGGWIVVLIAVTALAVATSSLVITLVAASQPAWSRAGAGGMMGGRGAYPGMMSGRGTGGEWMMGGGWMGGPQSQLGPQPGDPGFVAGTATAPRTIRIVAGPDLAFHPSTIRVAPGETIVFLLTTMGPTAHEFMVGPAADVAADVAGTPEIEAIGMMQTKALTYTFSGSGPYAFACHVTGHFEAGMSGTIVLVP